MVWAMVWAMAILKQPDLTDRPIRTDAGAIELQPIGGQVIHLNLTLIPSRFPQLPLYGSGILPTAGE
jgi:hypothetical protein